jgi:hypothetical protein
MLRWLRRCLLISSVCAVVLASMLWMRSHWLGDSLSLEWGDGSRLWRVAQVASARGGLAISYFLWENPRGSDAPHRRPRMVFHSSGDSLCYPFYALGWNVGHSDYPGYAPGPPGLLRWLGFEANCSRGAPEGTAIRYSVTVPLWFVVLVSAMPGYLHARKALVPWHVARRAVGRCLGGGYDLRATPDRCPECGRIARQAVRKP